MELTGAKAVFGLSAIATPPTSDSVTGSLQVGIGSETLRLTSATVVHSFEAVIAGASSDLVLDVSDMDSTGSTAWTAGAAQVEMATAVGTITTAGNMTCTVTAAGMSGSPKAISVAVALSDPAATWAGKVRTALAADSAVAAMFTVGGTGAEISLTRLPTKSYVCNGTTVNLYAANDSTLNIALADDTSAGITEDATSDDTTAGVLTAGVYAPQLDGKDVYGDAIHVTSIYGLSVKCASDSPAGVTLTQSTFMADLPIVVGGTVCIGGATAYSAGDDITIEPAGASAKVIVTLAGS